MSTFMIIQEYILYMIERNFGLSSLASQMKWFSLRSFSFFPPLC